MTMITYEDFKKVEIKIGKILSVEKIPDTDKLLKLSVDFAEKDEAGVPKPRQIVSGISMYFSDEQVLVGEKCFFVTNLEPRTIRGFESNGMLFAAGGHDGVPFSFIRANSEIPEGTLAN